MVQFIMPMFKLLKTASLAYQMTESKNGFQNSSQGNQDLVQLWKSWTKEMSMVIAYDKRRNSKRLFFFTQSCQWLTTRLPFSMLGNKLYALLAPIKNFPEGFSQSSGTCLFIKTYPHIRIIVEQINPFWQETKKWMRKLSQMRYKPEASCLSLQ